MQGHEDELTQRCLQGSPGLFKTGQGEITPQKLHFSFQ